MLFQAFDDEHTSPGCVFNDEGENGPNDQPPSGPEDVKHFDILEFVKSQDEAPQQLGFHDIKTENPVSESGDKIP